MNEIFSNKGGVPTPFDRNLGIKFGNKALVKMVEILNKTAQESIFCFEY